ncbi:MAG: hypothetical protein PWQ37_2340 [Candidatus Petromonas sp.]|jgi:hypothetical protein|nr:hypothetical protein [Candidatus Petromonas sp.]
MNRKIIIEELKNELKEEVVCSNLNNGCESCKYIRVCILLDEASELAGNIDVA